MENLNKLTFITHKVDETKIYVPMEKITQEFEAPEYIKPYIFKVVYVAKHNRDDTYIVYLSPDKNVCDHIVKATIPFEVIRTNKILPTYNYDRELTSQERFFINERIYREIDKLNNYALKGKASNCYVIVFGYMVNKYKNDNAMTTIKEGVQEFRMSQETLKRFNYKNITTKCFVSSKYSDIMNVGKIFKDDIEFVEVPKDFIKK